MLNFGALGPLEMTIDGVAVPLGTPKQRAVLAALLINRNRPVAIDALIEAAWEQGLRRGHEKRCTRMCQSCVA